MSSYECKLPENPNQLPNPIGQPVTVMVDVLELEFPRKLEHCVARVWIGSECRAYSTHGCWGIEKVREMWLLASNVIKIDDGECTRVYYNVPICVEYCNSLGQE